MNNPKEVIIDEATLESKIISWLFGTGVLAAGIINMFWGNDPEFGVFIALLSLVYFLPVKAIVKKYTGFVIHKMNVLRIVLALFIIWAVLGVGELFEKIELMQLSF